MRAATVTADNRTAITLVDDDPLVLKLLRRATELWHYPAQCASSAERAVELLERHPTPILLTDLQMPGKGGVWLVREARQRWPEICVIVLTATHDLQMAIECLNAGANRYLLKPIRLDELRQALEAAILTTRMAWERGRYQQELEQTVRKRNRQVRKALLSGINSLILVLEACDPYTSGHSQRVRRYAVALGEALRLDPRELRRLGLAAKLHDIGKVGIPEAILHKTTGLTEEEHHIIQSHPLIGERILRPVIRSSAVLAAIRGHHERIDGRGYPDGLAGDAIPKLARMVSVADCFDALTSGRPYRAPLTVAEASDVLRRAAGTQLDAEYVHVFLRLLSGSLPLG
jgi:response regulator RpfG family c-di-GMP phosphodiesterase